MQKKVVSDHMSRIHDKYKTIESLTNQLDVHADQEDIDQVLDRREKIISAISKERQELDAREQNWRQLIEGDASLSGMVQEIKKIIASVAAMDSQIEEVVRNRMHAIRTELQGMYKNSRAAGAYIVQSSFVR